MDPTDKMNELAPVRASVGICHWTVERTGATPVSTRVASASSFLTSLATSSRDLGY